MFNDFEDKLIIETHFTMCEVSSKRILRISKMIPHSVGLMMILAENVIFKEFFQDHELRQKHIS